MIVSKDPRIMLCLPPLDTPTAAWLIDLCGHLQTEIWRKYGDALEAYWTTTEPGQPIYGPLDPSQRRKATKR